MELNSTVEECLSLWGVERLYYMAHVKNIPSILHYGIVSRNMIEKAGGPNSDISLAWMQDQRERTVPLSGRPLHDYANLYFATHTPMQFVCTHENKWGHPVWDQRELVFIEVDPIRIFKMPSVIFTDGGAGLYRTEFYDDLRQLGALDWDIIRKRRGTSREFRLRKSAEVLVPKHIPPELFTRVVAFDVAGLINLNTECGLFVADLADEKLTASLGTSPLSALELLGRGCLYAMDTSLYY